MPTYNFNTNELQSNTKLANFNEYITQVNNQIKYI